MRSLFVLISALFLIAAAPEDEARELMDAGQPLRAFEIDAAAAQGDIDAIDYLAWFYDEGRVVHQDRVRAAALYRQAADRGQRHAQWRLGVMLDLAQGVAEDPVEAVRLFRLAVDQGSPNAHVSLGVMYATGRGVPRDYGESRRHYLEAARLGEPHGFYGVGVLYSNGEGVAADRQEALAWTLVAATLGDSEAARAAENFNLGSEATAAAVERANAILWEYGYQGMRVEFRDIDAERANSITN